MAATVAKDVGDLLNANDMYLPAVTTDLPGAALGLLRLQRTYGFKARDIAQGIIPHTTTKAHKLSALDCINISDVALAHQMYVQTKDWIECADWLITTMPTHRHGNVSTTTVNEYMSYIMYLSGDLEEALKYTRRVLRQNPKHQGAYENNRIYSWYVENDVEWDNE